MCDLSFSKVSFMNEDALAFWSIDVQNLEFLVDFSFDEYKVYFFLVFCKIFLY